MKLIHRVVLLAFFAFGFFTSGQAQQMNVLINQVNGIRKHLPVEKLYLQLDKPSYLQHDTIWFKAYLLDADYLMPSVRSGLLYIELDDIDNKSIKRIMVPLASGISWGNMILDEGIPEGNYTLRAYTNWMRNFSEDYVFKKDIYIASAMDQVRLVAAGFKQSNLEGKDNIRANILISNINGQPERLKDMQLKVIDGKQTLLKSGASTGVDGKLEMNFDLPENTETKNLSIVAKEITKGPGDTIAKLIIPVTINRPENTDLQFMPEGGNFVTGIPVKVGFKAIAEDGRSVGVSGKVYDSKQQEVAAFKSTFKGMGSFELAPQAGESYTAKIDLTDGSQKSYMLPKVSSTGTGLCIKAYKGTDTLQVFVAVMPHQPATNYYLIGQSRAVVCYAARLTPKTTLSTLFIPTSLFPTGIARFTLLNDADQLLNERICYINHQDNLRINVVANSNNYAPHDSVALKIHVTDKNGNPVRGSFSMAVTDDSQVRTDSTGSNMVNDFLLTSDLKGTVEEPGYYFENSSPERVAALDNLMLTQGWTGYDWKQITGPEIKPGYAAEREFTVQGTVLNAFNKPVSGTGIVLLSKKPTLFMDTVTDKDGRFLFRGLFPVDIDTAAYILQAKNKRGKDFNVGIIADEFKPPVFAQSTHRISPWYVNSDSSLMKGLNNRKTKQQAESKLMGQNVLKEVVIKAKKVVHGSKNLNGPGEADEVLDQKDMENAGKMMLYQVLLKLDGFKDNLSGFTIHGNPVVLIIDGINVYRFFKPSPPFDMFSVKVQERLFLKSYMDNIAAEDMVGIESMYSFSKYIKYDDEFYHEATIKNGPPDLAFLEITTRSGNGAYMKATPGMYLYKPLAFSLPSQFYRPKYILKNKKSLLPDLRSTLHWEPNIITDTAGNATVSFYSADKPAGYTVILEGTDLEGRVGFITKKLTVK